MKELIWIYLVNEGMKKIMEVDILGKWKTNALTFSIIKKNKPTNKQTKTMIYFSYVVQMNIFSFKLKKTPHTELCLSL